MVLTPGTRCISASVTEGENVREKSSAVSVWMFDGTLSRSIRAGSDAAGAVPTGRTVTVAGATRRGRLTVDSGVVAMTRTSGSVVVSGSCAEAAPAANATMLTDPRSARKTPDAL